MMDGTAIDGNVKAISRKLSRTADGLLGEGKYFYLWGKMSKERAENKLKSLGVGEETKFEADGKELVVKQPRASLYFAKIVGDLRPYWGRIEDMLQVVNYFLSRGEMLPGKARR